MAEAYRTYTIKAEGYVEDLTPGDDVSDAVDSYVRWLLENRDYNPATDGNLKVSVRRETPTETLAWEMTVEVEYEPVIHTYGGYFPTRTPRELPDAA